MFCDGCGRGVPSDAQFCIYCAKPVGVAPMPIPPVVEQPATGPTVRLKPVEVRKPPKLTPRAQVAKVAPVKPQRPAPRRKRQSDHSGAVFIIGFLFLIAIGPMYFWPWLFVLVGLTRFMKHSARGRPNRAFGKLVFWLGLAALWYTPFLWPGVMLLLFASHMLGKQQHSVSI